MRYACFVLMLCGPALLPWSANAQFAPTKKLDKDYYVVRKGKTNQCKIVPGRFGEPPEGMVGDAPYASKDYAKAALKTFAECKGGAVEDLTE